MEVGTEKRIFVVHKDVLRYYSDFFATSLDGHYREAQENLNELPEDRPDVIELPEDRPDVIELFVNWLYSQRFQWTDDRTATRMTWPNMTQLHVFADLHGIPTLKELTITAIFECYANTPRPWRFELMREVSWVYAHTVESSRLRKLLVDYAVWDAFGDDEYSEYGNGLTADFLLDVARALKHRVTDRADFTPYMLGRCDYHDHDILVPCVV